MIEYFRIEIKPWRYANPSNVRELEIAVQFDGRLYNINKIVGEDELKSYWDLIIDEAKEQLAKAMTESCLHRSVK